MKYYLVNVFSENGGYSFVVYTELKGDDSILNGCLNDGLFKNEEDVYVSEVLPASDEEVSQFISWDSVYTV